MWRVSEGTNASDKMMAVMNRFDKLFANPFAQLPPKRFTDWCGRRHSAPPCGVLQSQECQEVPAGCRIRFRKVECIILSVNDTYMDAQEVMHMTDYSKITALYSRLSVGDEDRDGGESNSIQNQKIFFGELCQRAAPNHIRHYIDDDESGRFF